MSNNEPIPFKRKALDAGRILDQLRESERIFALLVASVKEYGIFMLDVEGRVSTWNAGAEMIQGYNADEIIGQHFSIFYTPDALDEARNIQHPERELRIAASEGRYEEEGWRVKKDGSRFWASVVITAVWQDKKLVGFAKVTRDLTERRAGEEARREAARQEAQFKLIRVRESDATETGWYEEEGSIYSLGARIPSLHVA